MILQDIIKHINRLISNNSSYNLNFDKLEFYIDGAVDHINSTLKENFKTPREYFDCNIVDELISYSDYYLGVFENIENINVEDIDIGTIYYKYTPLTKSVCAIQPFNCCDTTLVLTNTDTENNDNGYYVMRENGWEFVDSISDISDIVSFDDKDLSHFVSKFDYRVIPEKYIRSCLVYLAAAYYLEEEDELENQYTVFKQRAEQVLLDWLQQEYSVFDISDSNRKYI